MLRAEGSPEGEPTEVGAAWDMEQEAASFSEAMGMDIEATRAIVADPEKRRKAEEYIARAGKRIKGSSRFAPYGSTGPTG